MFGSKGREAKRIEALCKKRNKDYRQFKEVGETFDYMGIKMLVIGYDLWTCKDGYSGYGISSPNMDISYVDKKGQLYHNTIWHEEIEALRQAVRNSANPMRPNYST